MKNVFSIFSRSTNSFDGEQEGEHVVLLLRRHPFVILIKMLFSVILGVVPVVVIIFFSETLASYNLLSIVYYLASLWYLVLWSMTFYILTMYTLDVWIVTNKRIISSTQCGFFNRTVSELHLERIQDISVETNGLIETVLKFGDLQIQTAAAEERFRFHQIPNPIFVKDEVMRLASRSHPLHP